MKTRRLYYTDSNLLLFKAKIIEQRQEDNKYITILDKTAFYPTSGGQQHDIGMLGTQEVTNVIDDDQILHITNSVVGEVGEYITGQINYERRHKNRQQHTAQHILSQSFCRLYDFTTMSVHLGENYGNIELDTNSISDTQLQKAEFLSNQIISENRNVEAIIVQSDNIAKFNLRRPPKRTGEIRLIQIDDFECTACGGTHVKTTSEIQLIKIVSTEKIRGRVAVNFLCGNQAIQDYSNRFKITDSISKKLTCGIAEIENHFDKLVEENKILKKDMHDYQRDLIPTLINSLLSNIEVINNVHFISTNENRFDKQLTNQFTIELSEKCKGIALVMYNDKIIIGCAKITDLNAGEIAKKMSSISSLKGGGNATIAQIGGVNQNDFMMYKSMIIEIVTQGINEK